MLESIASGIWQVIWGAFNPISVSIIVLQYVALKRYFLRRLDIQLKESGMDDRLETVGGELMNSIKNTLKNVFLNTERKQAFWQHEVESHQDSLQFCRQGNCSQLG